MKYPLRTSETQNKPCWVTEKTPQRGQPPSHCCSKRYSKRYFQVIHACLCKGVSYAEHEGPHAHPNFLQAISQRTEIKQAHREAVFRVAIIHCRLVCPSVLIAEVSQNGGTFITGGKNIHLNLTDDVCSVHQHNIPRTPLIRVLFRSQFLKQAERQNQSPTSITPMQSTTMSFPRALCTAAVSPGCILFAQSRCPPPTCHKSLI